MPELQTMNLFLSMEIVFVEPSSYDVLFGLHFVCRIRMENAIYKEKWQGMIEYRMSIMVTA